MSRIRLATALAVAALLAPSAALAHAGGDHVHGFGLGLLHPLTGADHLLAMVAVGLVAAATPGAWRILVPTAFLAAMAGGAALGFSGTALPGMEAGIAVSLVALGLLVSSGRSLPAPALAATAAVAGLFHGAAHGAEIDPTASALAYAAGFLLATTVLHAAGVFAAANAGRLAALGLRVAGGATALLGLSALAGIG